MGRQRPCTWHTRLCKQSWRVSTEQRPSRGLQRPCSTQTWLPVQSSRLLATHLPSRALHQPSRRQARWSWQSTSRITWHTPSRAVQRASARQLRLASQSPLDTAWQRPSKAEQAPTSWHALRLRQSSPAGTHTPPTAVQAPLSRQPTEIAHHWSLAARQRWPTALHAPVVAHRLLAWQLASSLAPQVALAPPGNSTRLHSPNSLQRNEFLHVPAPTSHWPWAPTWQRPKASHASPQRLRDKPPMLHLPASAWQRPSRRQTFASSQSSSAVAAQDPETAEQSPSWAQTSAYSQSRRSPTVQSWPWAVQTPRLAHEGLRRHISGSLHSPA